MAHKCPAVLWHEMEYVERRVAWSDMLLWLEGKSFPLGVPKAFREADIEYNPTGTPVFFTGGHKLHHPDPLKHAMIDRRMHYMEFYRSMPKEAIREGHAGLKDCGRCFARFILGDLAEQDPVADLALADAHTDESSDIVEVSDSELYFEAIMAETRDGDAQRGPEHT